MGAVSAALRAVQRLLQRRHAERGVHRVGQPPGENRPARPVDDGDQVEKAAADRDIGDVGRPDLVWPLDRQIAQQVGINLVSRSGLGRSRLRPERFDPHPPHQPPHALAVDGKALLAQRPRDAPGPEERTRGEQRVDAPPCLEVVVIGRSRVAIDARARQAQHGALPADRQADMRAIELALSGKCRLL